MKPGMLDPSAELSRQKVRADQKRIQTINLVDAPKSQLPIRSQQEQWLLLSSQI